MIRSELEQMIKDLSEADTKERLFKGSDYSRPDEDSLSNFRDVGDRLGIEPIKVWGVYFLKQVIAVERFIREGTLDSESIDGRFMDIRNYAFLGQALLKEETGDRVFMKELKKIRLEAANAEVDEPPVSKAETKTDKLLAFFGLE